MVRVGQYIGGWLAKGLYREQGSARKREGEREGEQETAQEAEGEIDEDGGEGRKEGEKVCIKEREREKGRVVRSRGSGANICLPPGKLKAHREERIETGGGERVSE